MLAQARATAHLKAFPHRRAIVQFHTMPVVIQTERSVKFNECKTQWKIKSDEILNAGDVEYVKIGANNWSLVTLVQEAHKKASFEAAGAAAPKGVKRPRTMSLHNFEGYHTLLRARNAVQAQQLSSEQVSLFESEAEVPSRVQPKQTREQQKEMMSVHESIDVTITAGGEQHTVQVLRPYIATSVLWVLFHEDHVDPVLQALVDGGYLGEKKKQSARELLPDHSNIFQRQEKWVVRTPSENPAKKYSYHTCNSRSEAVQWQATLLADAAINGGTGEAEDSTVAPYVADDREAARGSGGHGEDDHEESAPPGAYAMDHDTEGGESALFGAYVAESMVGDATAAIEDDTADIEDDNPTEYAPPGLCGTARVTMNQNSLYDGPVR